MPITYLLPITNMDSGQTLRVELSNTAGGSMTFADGTSAHLASALGGSSYFLYSTQWPVTSLMPYNVIVKNHSSGSVLGNAAFNTYDILTSNVGAGGVETTIAIDDPDGTPLQGVEVWITTDVSGSNTVAGSAYTDNFGQATFYLDAGTYYVWKQKPGYEFSNPASITVS